MLASGPYPQALKRRVGGNLGHLSNYQASELVKNVDLDRLQHLVVSHISEKNNLPALAEAALAPALQSWSGQVTVATQAEGFDWLSIA
jgi:phosphoribosyl 1,2-cyclic phosphodiesterase